MKFLNITATCVFLKLINLLGEKNSLKILAEVESFQPRIIKDNRN